MSEKSIFRPSSKYQVHILIGVAICFACFVLPLVLLALIPELGLTYLLLFLLANIVWLVPTIILIPVYCRSIEYEFSERDLLVRRGIITRSESMVPYRMVTNVETRRGPIARALGIGTLKVHTAGYSQQSQAEASLNGLANWAEVQQRLLCLIHDNQTAESGEPIAGTAASRTGAESREISTLLSDILAEVRKLRSERE